MGLIKRLGLAGRPSTSSSVDDEPTPQNPQRKKSEIPLVPLSEVTEASLKVFRQLPGTIRHDPSMVSFQQEHERWKGKYSMLRIEMYGGLENIGSETLKKSETYLSFKVQRKH